MGAKESNMTPRFEFSQMVKPIIRTSRQSPVKLAAAVFLVFLVVVMVVSTHFWHSSDVLSDDLTSDVRSQRKLETLLNCNTLNHTKKCPKNDLKTYTEHPHLQSNSTCPEYFRYIHEDLRLWKKTGITGDMVERAKGIANFRLVIINGKAYFEKFQRSYETRDSFTLWGILQLLRRYPGKLPDLEIMFDCVDWPVIKSNDYDGQRNVKSPPPLFGYCGNDETLDIVFPDWSFWGWEETNIKPWEQIIKDLKEGNKKKKWNERKPYAFWKGNPTIAETRHHLMICNVSQEHDYNARLYLQDWGKEKEQNFKQSELANQCDHRYKIYIEGSAWSVSLKYILACDSLTLVVKPHYYDFFSRGLIPTQHYWPIKDDDKCRSIEFAVDWGNNHKLKAQEIGKAGSKFIQEELKMDYVYDYMFHLLNEYAKLMTYKPTIPKNAIEICSESIICSTKGSAKRYMTDSFVKSPAVTGPCILPPPYDHSSIYNITRRNENAIEEVDILENRFWEK